MNKAILALEDGTIFNGVQFGANNCTTGEVVFNTAMTGYQEILSDPSYCEQIITFTATQIGNTGINNEDYESKKIWSNGLIVHELSELYSNWRANKSLQQFCLENNLTGISNVDTRALTLHIRKNGAMRGCITSKLSEKDAIKKAKESRSLNGLDLARVVSTEEKYVLDSHLRGNDENVSTALPPLQKGDVYHIVVLDFGVKQNILDTLLSYNCNLTILPAESSFEEIMAENPDGVLLSNGPGDPFACNYAIEYTKKLLEKNVPILGICLGHQLLALALGAKTYKMPFGHHGANHPVQNLTTKQVFVTSQNHGFAVEDKSLPQDLEITHISLFDKTIQGIKSNSYSAIGFQGHPEAGPGPNDIKHEIFSNFIALIKNDYAKKK